MGQGNFLAVEGFDNAWQCLASCSPHGSTPQLSWRDGMQSNQHNVLRDKSCLVLRAPSLSVDLKSGSCDLTRQDHEVPAATAHIAPVQKNLFCSPSMMETCTSHSSMSSVPVPTWVKNNPYLASQLLLQAQRLSRGAEEKPILKGLSRLSLFRTFLWPFYFELFASSWPSPCL